MKRRNVTGILLAIVYSILVIEFLTNSPDGEAPNHPLWVYLMIPLGIGAITSLFDHLIKFDFFEKRNNQ